jgi:hypothetical protein
MPAFQDGSLPHPLIRFSPFSFVQTHVFQKTNAFFHPMDNSKNATKTLVLSILYPKRTQTTQDNPLSPLSVPPSPLSPPPRNGPTCPRAGLFPLIRVHTAPPPSPTPPIASPWLFDPRPRHPSWSPPPPSLIRTATSFARRTHRKLSAFIRRANTIVTNFQNNQGYILSLKDYFAFIHPRTPRRSRRKHPSITTLFVCLCARKTF